MRNLKGINLAITILSGMLILTLGFGYIQINNNKIAKNTYIKNINVGNLSKEEAKKKIEDEYEIDTITFTYEDKKWNIKPSDVDAYYDIQKTVNNAYNVNRNNNIFSNIIDTLKSNFGVENHINVAVDFNEDKIIKELEEIAKNIDVDMANAKLDIVNNYVNIVDDKAGLEVDIDETLNNLKKSLQNGIFEESLVVTKVEPEIKSEDLTEINTLLGSYKTSLSDVSPGRVENIKIATERTSGVLLMPGEEFSYNKHTGLRTVKNGYKNATVIVSGEAVQGVGGGVCQVSTTLYNAVLYSGLDIVKVSNHSIPSSYVDKGRDATVSDSGLDFIFKNNYNQPVYIQNYYNNGVITCQVYGNSKDVQNIEISTNVDNVIEAPVKKENDTTLDKGTEKIIERGRDAYTVSTYRIYYDEKGEVSKKEKVATSFYPSKQQIIAVGTKKEELDSKEEENESLNNNPSNNSSSDNSSSNDSQDKDNSSEKDENKDENNNDTTNKEDIPVDEE